MGAVARTGGRTYAPSDFTTNDAKVKLDAAGLMLDANGVPVWKPDTGMHRTDPVAEARGAVAPNGMVYVPTKDTYETQHMDMVDRIALTTEIGRAHV